MKSTLEPQLKNASKIKSILKKVNVSFTLNDGRNVKTLLVYLPLKDGASCYSEFFEEIKAGILANFTFSCSEVEKKLGISNPNSPEELFNKAVRKFSQHTAQGELGELILFTLLDVYLEAPKILSKISLKTNPRMPVYGADAIHGKFHGKNFRLYLGESKLHKEYKSAATEAVKSIKNAKDEYTKEFDLLDSYMEFPNINENLKEKIINLINPFSNPDHLNILHSPCFIGFNEKDLISNAKSEEEFIKNYTELADDYIKDFFAKVEKQQLHIDEVSFLILPFSCITEMVQNFTAYMGIEQ